MTATTAKPLPIGTVYDGHKIVEVTEHDQGDQYQPYQYMLDNGETVWIPLGHPVCCPFCKGTDITTFMVEWHARSLEPCDPNNEGTINEHQCHDCAKSFWS